MSYCELCGAQEEQREWRKMSFREKEMSYRKKIREMGYDVSEGAYSGTSDDVMGTYYAIPVNSTVIDRRGVGELSIKSLYYRLLENKINLWRQYEKSLKEILRDRFGLHVTSLPSGDTTQMEYFRERYRDAENYADRRLGSDNGEEGR